ncbi:MAG: L-lactate dehydrogenase [bacterium]
MKISIIGSGMVGATFAYRLLVSGMASEIVLNDVNKERAEAEAEELNHCLATEQNTRVRAGSYQDTADSDFIVITAGMAQKVGQTRLDLASANATILRGILKEVCSLSPNAVLIIASNPLDVMTYIAVKESGFTSNKVIGSGTVLDSARFRYYLGQKLGANPKDIFAYVIGEHGDSQVQVFSGISIKGLSLQTYCKEFGINFTQQDEQDIVEKTSRAAYKIIKAKGSTYYGIASSLMRIVKAVWRDEKVLLPVCCLLQGEYALDDVCLAVPAVVGKDGIKKIVQLDLTEIEKSRLAASSKIVKDSNIL